MADLLIPRNNVTFTVTKVPQRPAQRKTIQRLMRLQPRIQRGLQALQLRRRREDNKTYIRAGVPWTNRAKATKLTRVAEGASFTLRLTPQIIPDLRSVERFLGMKKA